MTSPRRTKTAPTIGFGEVSPYARWASFNACRMNFLWSPVAIVLLSWLRFLREQRGRELFRVERLEIICLLAETDKLDWQVQLLLDGEDHPASAGAVEFRDDQPGQLHCLM